MKYLIIEREGMELALIFADYIQHREAARGLVDAKLISAGFCSFHHMPEFPGTLVHIATWGRSDSLNLDSRPVIDAASILFTLTLPSLRERPPLFTDEPQLQLTAATPRKRRTMTRAEAKYLRLLRDLDAELAHATATLVKPALVIADHEALTIRMRRASSIALELEHLAKGTTAPEPGI